MKKSNKLLRTSGILLVLTLITSCFVGGTFAKYVTKAESSDSARVAKWGVTISNGESTDGSGVYTGDAFLTTYWNNDVEPVESVDGAKVIAPGTSGTFKMLKITGTPEVAVEIETLVDVELTGDWEDESGNFYCPLQFKINNVPQTISADSAEAFETGLKSILTKYTNTEEGKPIPAGTDLAEDASLPVLFWENADFEWQWPYHTSEEDDLKDTHLGNIAAGVYSEKKSPNIKITFTTTVTQVD